MKRILWLCMGIVYLSFLPRAGLCARLDVRYSFDRDFPPFSFVREGVPAGFDIELAKEIFSGRDVDLKLNPTTWDSAQKEISSGAARLTSGMAKTDQRLESYDFTAYPSSNLNIRLFVRTGTKARSLSELKGQKVSTQRGSLYQTMVEQAGGIEPVLFDTEPDAIAALAEGKVAGFVGAEQTARYIIAKRGYRNISAVGTPLKVTRIYFAVRKGDRRVLELFDRGLREVLTNGTYDRLYRKWFVEELTSGDIERMIEAARDASLNAYAPYSNFQVGSAVLTRSGGIYTGCNIENALFGLTSSALKTAVFKAISEGDVEIRAVVNVMPDGTIGVPAADERQIVFEFGRGILVVVEEERGKYSTPMISELLPYAFSLSK